ncbi:threonine aldolase [Aerophototrophica crusticola]|uniref:Threonine aldolase n=1 Tax=Aerophototrophica crusticola TaxID=1709002 RepID=A0A858R9N7_9PROT|nr:threonine aldolase [Rhodospirillaceae bacterium B3]
MGGADGRLPHLGARLDEYGEGPAVRALEERCAGLLGKPAALFFHKGVVAQQAALLAHGERTGRTTVALHPKSHIALDEEDAIERLTPLRLRRTGPDHRPFNAAELAAVREPLAAVSVELPLRRAAFQGNGWEELGAISGWCRERAVPLHLDGARLWEVQPWLGRPLADIAGLADTVYVSFYKGLGGLGGCVLAGPVDLIEATRAWRTRFGGNLYTAFPLVVTALDGIERHLPRMGAYHEHAKALAVALAGVDGLRVNPGVPHGNSFQLLWDAPADRLETVLRRLAGDEGIWLAGRVGATPVPGWSSTEVSVGDATLAWDLRDVADLCARVLQAARTA